MTISYSKKSVLYQIKPYYKTIFNLARDIILLFAPSKKNGKWNSQWLKLNILNLKFFPSWSQLIKAGLPHLKLVWKKTSLFVLYVIQFLLTILFNVQNVNVFSVEKIMKKFSCLKIKMRKDVQLANCYHGAKSNKSISVTNTCLIH